MDNSIKKKARKFQNDFGLQNVSLDNLRSAIQRQGYTIVEYNNIFNDENVAALLDVLNLEDYCGRTKGFTYTDSKRRLVFLHEDLSYDEKLMVLAHEEGHIYCNHFCSTPILGRDVMEENEASEFAHYLLHQSIGQKVSCFIQKYKKATISAAIAVLLVLVACIVYGEIKQEERYYGDFYVTSTGNKYHEKDCIFVKCKDNVERLTIEQFENGEYEPCGICLPHASQRLCSYCRRAT